MSTDTDSSPQTTVHTTTDGRAVIKQSNGSEVLLSSEQILAVIQELHACYDYCASWKDAAEADDAAIATELQS